MSENRIVFATGNAGKMKEIRLILADLGMEILSMKEAGADPVIVENGKTFGENAEIKARAVWAETGELSLRMIPVWWWTAWEVSRGSIQPDIWARIRPTR